MELKDIESLRQIISSLFIALRLVMEHVQKVSASDQALRDAIAVHDPELFQKFQEMYPASERLSSEAATPLLRPIDEQLAALPKMGPWVN